jgi:homoserine kinase
VRQAAIDAGALGCSISGAGPTMFAWSSTANANKVLQAMRTEFGKQSIQLDEWIVQIQSSGARVVPE